MRVLLLMLTALLALSCSPSTSGPQPNVPDAPFAQVDDPDGKQFLNPDAKRAEASGAGKVIILAVEAAAPGDRVTGTLQVPASSCVLLMSRVGPNINDVDLFAYADDGTVLGSDERPDKTPTLLVCPPHPKRVYVVARVAAGHGLVAVGGQLVDPKVAQKVDGSLKEPAKRKKAGGLPQWMELDSKLAERRRSLGSTWSDVRRVAVPLDPRTPTVVSARIEAGRCLDFLVVPADEVSHLQVQLKDPSGRIIGRGQGNGRDRELVVCSPERATLTLEVRPHAGRGLGAILISRSAAGAAADLARSVLRHDVAPLVPLETLVQQHAKTLTATDLKKPSTVLKGQLRIGRRESKQVKVEAGCQRLDVLSGTPVRGVRAWLWDDGGHLQARGHGGPVATLFRCGPAAKLRLDVEADARGGPFAVELRGARDGKFGELVSQPLAASRLLASLSERGLLRKLGKPGKPRVYALRPEKQAVTEMVIPRGRCVDASLAIGAGGRGVELRLLDARSNEELARGHGNSVAFGRACALGRTSVELRIEGRLSSGQAQGLLLTRLVGPN